MSYAGEIIEFWEYPYESYTAQTDDGYSVGLHRIPDGHRSSLSASSTLTLVDTNLSTTKPVVLIWHGLSISSDVFVCNAEREKNMAFFLADAGFDVWLGNTRGNKYSKTHQRAMSDSNFDGTFKPAKQPEAMNYWEFTIDHLARYDVPATVDFILNKTGQSSLAYIGYSQGTAQAFAALSLNEELNQKISTMIALAPALSPKRKCIYFKNI
jgi:lysosomal acid lipase/cholesteryl ester hydrolase